MAGKCGKDAKYDINVLIFDIEMKTLFEMSCLPRTYICSLLRDRAISDTIFHRLFPVKWRVHFASI